MPRGGGEDIEVRGGCSGRGGGGGMDDRMGLHGLLV